MVKTENYKNGLVRTYSDAGLMSEQDGTGQRYSEAIDPEGSGRTYTETDEPISDEEARDRLLAILTGGAE